MRFKLALFLCCLAWMKVHAHGGHMASFKYIISEGEIFLEFKIENEILDHFQMEKECDNFQVATAICLLKHINQNSSLEIDGQPISFELQSSKKDKGFFSLILKANGSFSNAKNIKISNRCFLKYDQKFENRIIFQQGEMLKSYRLNQKHQAIEVL